MTPRTALGKVGAAFVSLVFVAVTFLALHEVRGSSSTAGGDAVASAPPSPIIVSLDSPVTAGPLVGPDGEPIILSPPDPKYVPDVTGFQAVEEATPHVDTSKVPTSIVAQLAIFGSGDPVWVVTFDGICASISDGPPGTSELPCPITQESALVDATTGRWASNYSGSATDPRN